MQRFIGKKIHKKYVRPICNSAIPHKVHPVTEVKNNEQKEEEIVMNEKITNIVNILDKNTAEGEKLPKRKVKVEKKEKGLLERTDNSTILLTEDNKMLLND